MFLLYRGLAYSAGHLIAAAAYQFLRYRGRVRNENLAVFLLHRFVRELAVCCCAAQTDFLPYRIAEKQAKPDDLLLAARLPCLELAQRYCAAERILLAYFVPGYRSDGLALLRCRQAVPGCAECWAAKPDCSALHWVRPYSVRLAVCQAAAQRCCAVVQTRPVPSAPVRWYCDTIFLRDRSADWYCAADLCLPVFLPCRAKQSRRDSALSFCCAGGILTGNVPSVPAAYSA